MSECMWVYVCVSVHVSLCVFFLSLCDSVCVCVCQCMCVWQCVCQRMCLCVRERERENVGDECVTMCVCLCVFPWMCVCECVWRCVSVSQCMCACVRVCVWGGGGANFRTLLLWCRSFKMHPLHHRNSPLQIEIMNIIIKVNGILPWQCTWFFLFLIASLSLHLVFVRFSQLSVRPLNGTIRCNSRF